VGVLSALRQWAAQVADPAVPPRSASPQQTHLLEQLQQGQRGTHGPGASNSARLPAGTPRHGFWPPCNRHLWATWQQRGLVRCRHLPKAAKPCFAAIHRTGMSTISPAGDCGARWCCRVLPDARGPPECPAQAGWLPSSLFTTLESSGSARLSGAPKLLGGLSPRLG